MILQLFIPNTREQISVSRDKNEYNRVKKGNNQNHRNGSEKICSMLIMQATVMKSLKNSQLRP